MAARRALTVVALVVGLGAAGCSGDDDSAQAGGATTADPVASTPAPPGSASAPSTSAPPSTTAPARAAIDLSSVAVEPVPEGDGVPSTTAGDQLREIGYVEEELHLAGEAATYAGPANGPAVVATEGNPYVTRILVRRPVDPGRFSGRVVVEPFNTSGVRDNDAAWKLIGPQIVAQGDAWIGVTERAAAVAPLLEDDPVRYAGMELASNGYAWDVLSQLGGLLKENGDASPLAGLEVTRLYMTGYSQNGIETATYASAFGSLARMEDGSPIYDGYLPMARSGSLTPLDSGDAPLPAFEHLPTAAADVPIVELQTQSDVEGFSEGYTSPSGAAVRRDDSDSPDDLYRLYEIAGAPHVPSSPSCEGDGSTFPVAPFARAAYANLVAWAEDGVAPPRAERLSSLSIGVVSPTESDQYGNPVGGVRSPWVEVPLSSFQVHSPEGPVCQLVGNETPFDPPTVRSLYQAEQEYLDRFTESLDETIAAGFLLESDRAELLAEATADAADAFAQG